MANCHEVKGLKNIPLGAKKIVLAGNPNTGKSVFFNYFTGIYVDVSNYPGTTLDISSGGFGQDVIIDTPGVYGISSFNDEEKTARDIILSADLVINVVDAAHLERDLFLTQQIIDTGVPMVVALNMVDEAQRLGLNIDYEQLENFLDVPVIPTVAVKKKGLAQVKEQLIHAKDGTVTPGLEPLLKNTISQGCSQGDALLILEGDLAVSHRCGLPPETKREEIYMNRRTRVDEIVRQVLKETSKGASFSSLLGRWMIKPITGLPILALTLYAMYQFIGLFIAGTVVGITEQKIMLGMYEPAVRGIVVHFFQPDSAMGTILSGEFGLLTMTVTYIVGLLMPLVAGFYFFLSLFEDSGYLPRIATLVDRLLTGIGLNGRGIIPLILGFGCVTMATITTRLLSSDRERRIAIILLGLTIPCSAQMGVIAGMLASVGGLYISLYALVILVVLVIAGTILNTILPGKSSDLLIDLPPLRIPRLNNVAKKTGTKTYYFLKEAFPLFALGALIISVFQITGILEFLQNLLAPLTVGWLKLPKEASTAFIMGIVRRDFGAAGLTSMALTPVQIITALITITIFVPCIASILIIFKERSRKEAVLIWGSSWAVAFLVGGIVSQTYSFMGGNSNSQGILWVSVVFIGMAVATILGCRIVKAKACTKRGEQCV